MSARTSSRRNRILLLMALIVKLMIQVAEFSPDLRIGLNGITDAFFAIFV